MLQAWLTHRAPIDLIAASLDIGLGLVATAWVVILTVRRFTPGGTTARPDTQRSLRDERGEDRARGGR
jgi:hypothetical protein